MSAEETRAFVLRLQDLRESDRLVWLFTEEHGRVNAVARGARKSVKRFGGNLDLFQLVSARIHWRPRSGLQTLVECRTLQAFPRLRTDVERYAVASVLMELVSRLGHEGDADAALFERIFALMSGLAEAEGSPDQGELAAGIVALLAVAGFAGDLSRCSSCGEDLLAGRYAVYADPSGRVRCERCGPSAPSSRRLIPAEARTLAGWEHGERGPASPALVSVALSALHHLLGKRLLSEDFALGLLRPPAGAR